MECNPIKFILSLFCFPCHIFYHVGFILFIMIIIFMTLSYFLNDAKKNYHSSNSMNFVYYSYIAIAKQIHYFIHDTVHFCNREIFAFVMSFFTILLFYNCGGIFPHIEELTKDLNVCVAFALYGFFAVQAIAFTAVGPKKYLTHWTKNIFKTSNNHNILVYYIIIIASFIGNMMISIIALPMKILEIFSLLFSLTFRLFGNMFGGSIVVSLAQKMQTAGILYQIPMTIFGVQLLVLLYFSFFEGIIQASIFTLILLNTLGGFFEEENE
jgi:F0F1-type ATP synthase membrane subunit a